MRRFEEQPLGPPRRHRPATRPSEEHVGASAAGPSLSPATAPRLQRLAGNAAVSSLARDHDGDESAAVLGVVGKGGGRPLDPAVQTDMEQRLGDRFDDVRIHTDAPAAASATSVQALGYTVDNEIVFNEGQYSPTTESGRRTLAHELTHVTQQRSGPVDGTPVEGGIRVSDPSDRFEQEAEHNAERAIAGEGSTVTASAGGSVQRDAMGGGAGKEEDEDVQGLFAQRAAAPEEEKKDEDEAAGG